MAMQGAYAIDCLVSHFGDPFKAVRALQVLLYSALTHGERHRLRWRHAPCLESVRAGSGLSASSLPFVGPLLSVKGRQKQKCPQLKGCKGSMLELETDQFQKNPAFKRPFSKELPWVSIT
jgi:hypothetical protein